MQKILYTVVFIEMHCDHIDILYRIYNQTQKQIQYNTFMFCFSTNIGHTSFMNILVIWAQEEKQIIWIQGITVVSKSFWFSLSKAWNSL